MDREERGHEPATASTPRDSAKTVSLCSCLKHQPSAIVKSWPDYKVTTLVMSLPLPMEPGFMILKLIPLLLKRLSRRACPQPLPSGPAFARQAGKISQVRPHHPTGLSAPLKAPDDHPFDSKGIKAPNSYNWSAWHLTVYCLIYESFHLYNRLVKN